MNDLYSYLNTSKTDQMKWFYSRVKGSREQVFCQVVMNPVFCIYFIYNMRSCEISQVKVFGVEEIKLIWSSYNCSDNSEEIEHEFQADILSKTSIFAIFREIEICIKQFSISINDCIENKADVTELYIKFHEIHN